MNYTRKEDLHHKVYSETKSGMKVSTHNRTNNSPNGHFAVDGNRNNNGQLARLSGRGYAVDGNRNNDRQLAWLSGRITVDGNRSGSGSEPAWRAQTARFGASDGSTPCVVHQEEHLRYSDERW